MSTLTQFKYCNDIMTIEPQYDNINILLENDHHQIPIYVTSFIGSTHSGKSTLIQSLSQQKINVARVGCEQPTSANINYYDLPREDKIDRFLDFEGNSAGNKLPSDENITLPSNFSETQYCRLRRIAVSKLPGLAYVVSDIIVFVANVDFADYETFYEKIQKIAIDQATSNIDEAEKPSLILVSNRIADQNNNEYYDIDRITSNFIELIGEDFQELSKYYLGIKCVRIPNWNATSIDFYNQQIIRLRAIIHKTQEERSTYKIQTGTTYNPKLWTNLFLKSTAIFGDPSNRPFRMSEILVQCMVEESRNESITATMNFFKACRVDFSNNTFDILSYYSLLMLATHLVYSDLKKISAIGEGYNSIKLAKERRENYQETRKKFIEILNKLKYNDPQDTKITHRFVRLFKFDKILTKKWQLNGEDFDNLINFLEKSADMHVCYRIFLEIFMEFKREINCKDFPSELRYGNNCIVTGFIGGYSIPCGHNCFNENWIKFIRSCPDLIRSIYFHPDEIILLKSSMCPICDRINFAE
jgi:hypothetical protein